MKKYISILILGVITFSFFFISMGCSKRDKSVIATIGDEKIYLYEFEEMYLKNTPNPDSLKNKSIEEKRELLEKYIDFRLKVKDAKARGYDTLPDIVNDINEYKKNIFTFLIETEVTMPGIERLYDRKKVEYKVAHILINLRETGITPEDSVRAYTKADSVIQRLKNGEDFEVVALQMSEDQTVSSNKGQLGYISGGMTVTEFEDEVYNLGVGNYSKKPVRTIFGLHIIKVLDKRKSYESIRLSHIFFQEKRDSVGIATDSLEVLAKAMDALNRLKNGEDFATVAKETSMDLMSASKGGDIGYIQRRVLPPAIDSAISEIKVGEFTDLVRTNYGWHILKLTEMKELPSFERMKEQLKSEYVRTDGYTKALKKFIQKKREEYDYKTADDAVVFLYSKFDSTKTIGSQNIDSIFANDDKNKVLATFSLGEFKLGDLLQYLKISATFSGRAALWNAIVELMDEAPRQVFLNAVAFKEKLDKTDEYKERLDEYVNGLLKHKIEQEEINSKVIVSEDDLKNYYEAHLDKYTIMKNDTVKYKSFEEVRGEVANELQQTKLKERDNEYIQSLKAKYPVEIKESVLEKAFTKI
ncbi:MAG: peptidylprolyl isomerase [Ignavibacteria bacterium]|nr:peptidylprolyl isomerase [Ignavibacteria bacterium]